jgi:hypothetical protein
MTFENFTQVHGNNFIMHTTQAQQPVHNRSPKATFIFISSLMVFILIALYAINNSHTAERDSLPAGTVTISQETLEEKYGLRVNLVAVTGAGGFVDLRLKVLDGEKARSLLQDRDNFPSLFIDRNTVLRVPQETKEQEIRFENDGNLFLMFPNAGNVVKPGAPLRIMFGNLALEPTDVQ